jgi:endonuclease YncB( thermonuclease family)
MLAPWLLLALLVPQFRVREWVAVERVLDGDTLEVRRADGLARLRLLCVDAEERFHPGQSASPGKPQTVFGEETALWAERLFGALREDGRPARVGLCFPGEREERDVFGRLLCHVVLPDGRDYELELVRAGRSPYFNKYGNSEIAHADFVAAQSAAQAQALGIWNPRTNSPKTAGVPAARRDYEHLLPWWNARAAALDGFRRRRAAGERGLEDAADGSALHALAGQELELFCELEGRPHESGGELVLELVSRERGRHLSLVVPDEARAALAPAKLDDLAHEGHQNYFYVRGRIERGAHGLRLSLTDPRQLRRAGPEPGR